MTTPSVCCVVGTRPEVIKMAPVVRRLRALDGALRVRLLSTGQHRGLLDQALRDVRLEADDDLDLMTAHQGLADLTARALAGLGAYFEATRPDLVLGQGDTATVLAAALACFYTRTPFGHVEAGLRSGRSDSPFPEEMNRALVGRLAADHFAPTPAAARNLLREGVDPASVHVTGNTVVDALRWAYRHRRPHGLPLATPRFLLVTVHRRENHGEPLCGIAAALRALVDRHPDLSVVLPLHPNPAVRSALAGPLGGRGRFHVVEPLDYARFVGLLDAATLILTDSGGVQEEAAALGRRVLVLRDTTERPEAVESGHARLVGTRPNAIVAAAEDALREPPPRPAPPPAVTPFGDGRAAERIARLVAARLGVDPGPAPDGLGDWPPPEGR